MKHLYALSHSDFSSRIVNHEHWLYWGRVSKLLHASAPIHTSKPAAPQFVSNATLLQSRPGSDASAATTLAMPNPIESNAPRVELVFHVAEQTEFVDNETLRTCARPGARLEPYAKRCLTQKLQSPGKRMYFSQDQLGIYLDLVFFILRVLAIFHNFITGFRLLSLTHPTPAQKYTTLNALSVYYYYIVNAAPMTL